jgi:hypothetical protein
MSVILIINLEGFKRSYLEVSRQTSTPSGAGEKLSPATNSILRQNDDDRRSNVNSRNIGVFILCFRSMDIERGHGKLTRRCTGTTTTMEKVDATTSGDD